MKGESCNFATSLPVPGTHLSSVTQEATILVLALDGIERVICIQITTVGQFLPCDHILVLCCYWFSFEDAAFSVVFSSCD